MIYVHVHRAHIEDTWITGQERAAAAEGVGFQKSATYAE
jgi:hypothetical protein